MIFLIDLGLFLLAYLPTNILLVFFPFAMIFMPMSKCKGFLHILTTNSFFLTFKCTLLLSFMIFHLIHIANNVAKKIFFKMRWLLLINSIFFWCPRFELARYKIKICQKPWTHFGSMGSLMVGQIGHIYHANCVGPG